MNPAIFYPITMVAAGGALGAVLRYLTIQLVARMHAGMFPLGTLLVNGVGSFLIGLLMARYLQQDSESQRLFLVTGVLGGFTTFSAFSWDVLQLLQRGQGGQALLYVLGSVLLSVLAASIGYALLR